MQVEIFCFGLQRHVIKYVDQMIRFDSEIKYLPISSLPHISFMVCFAFTFRFIIASESLLNYTANNLFVNLVLNFITKH